ncbi:hypothetical protein EXIGLDRAFT_768177 [Exidia glandulosa HHB12029]|uniref:AAA+ ATPase domain-containing protein n=1 Tax=Exidia glandulosa HHB12029 TaxID=1314781 RepID=A0A165IE67_EXIGL|nr:hypothetical protein EXIGLDRAFT_768177 [Exidia glandulosa HHB12029]
MPPTQESVATTGAIADTGNGSEEASKLLILAAGIVHSAENVRLNRDNTIAFSRRVNELVVTIATELQERDASKAALSLLEGEVRNFERAIKAAHDDLVTRSKGSYVSQLLHREADAKKLLTHGENIHQACNTIIAAGYVRHSQSAKAALQQFENSRALEALEAHQADVAQHTSSNSRTTSSLNIPPRPQIFFGRAAELSALQSLLVAGPAGRVAVLGGPGMGKTSLAVTALHSDDVVARYGNRRFFIPCDAAEERNHCVFHIAATLGIIAAKRQDAEKALLTFLSSVPTLIVLDNFESVWESLDRRLDAERTLQLLASVESLALIITMRGTELPDGVVWTKPLLRPLQPLQPEASLQTFMAISDNPQDDHSLSVLLKLVENVPLAVTLLANLAQVESCDLMLRRWNSEKTAMLQRGGGTSKLTSLDISISISIQSPRMQSEATALQLLSILSLLKHGPIETDLGLMTSDALLSRHTIALSALLRTALCQRMRTGRIHVLSPIRQFMLENHPISEGLARPVYAHYFSVADLFQKEKRFLDLSNPSLLAEVDDVCTVVHHALHSGYEPRSAVEGAITTVRLWFNDGVGSPDVLPDAQILAQAEGFDDLTANCLVIQARMILGRVLPGDALALLCQARTLYEKIGDVIIDTTLHSADLLPLNTALASFEQIRPLVQSHSSKSPALLSRFVIGLGNLYMRSGRNQDARTCFHELLAIQRHSPNPSPRATAMAMYKLAGLEVDAGHLHTATQRLHELIELLYLVAAAMNRKIGWPVEIVRALCGFARVIEDSAAKPLLASILLLLRLWGLRPLLADALVTFGPILQRQRNFERAEARLKEALSHYEVMRNSRGSTRARIALESLKADRLAEETVTVA